MPHPFRMPLCGAPATGHARATVTPARVHTAVTMFADILSGCHIPDSQGVLAWQRSYSCFTLLMFSASLRLLAGVAGVVEQDFLAQACGVEVQVYFGG